MGVRQTIETGSGRNDYFCSSKSPQNGGVITRLVDVHNKRGMSPDATVPYYQEH